MIKVLEPLQCFAGTHINISIFGACAYPSDACLQKRIPVFTFMRTTFLECEKKRSLKISVNSLFLNKHMAVLNVTIGNVFLHNGKQERINNFYY